MDSDYHVKTEVFEGPLELLLQLIERRKLFISDISLAAVTDDYIERINQDGTLALPHAAHFVYVASTLLLIKSKSLLPTLTLTEEEAGDIEQLETRLKLYQRFKELSEGLQNLFGMQRMFMRDAPTGEDVVFAPGPKLALPAIMPAVERVLAALPKQERMPQAVVSTIVSLEEMIDRLSHRITKTLSLSFKEFAGGQDSKQDRLNVIVGFLALLELVKRGMIGARQQSHFDDIIIESDSIGIPRYH